MLASIGLLTLSLAGFFYHAFHRHLRAFALATFAGLGGFACLTLTLLALLWQHGPKMALTGGASYLIGAWIVLLVYFAAEFRYRIRLLGSILMPVALVLLVVGLFLGMSAAEAPGVRGLPGFVFVHLALLFLGFGMIFLAFAGALLYLFKTRALKHHDLDAADTAIPALSTSKRVTLQAFNCGFPLLTLAVIMGVVYAVASLQAGWLHDEHILWGGAIWVLYAVLFVSNQSGRLASATLCKWIVVLFAAVAVSLVFSSHDEVSKQLRQQTPAPTAETTGL